MKIVIDITNPKFGKFCSRRCIFFQWGVISDWCRFFGPLKRVRSQDGKDRYMMSYVSDLCKKARV
jgi:hypothetical protein